MSRITPAHWRDLEKIVLKCGLKFMRKKGSHRSYGKPGLIRPVIIPERNEVPVTIIRAIMDTLGLSRDEYFRLLHE